MTSLLLHLFSATYVLDVIRLFSFLALKKWLLAMTFANFCGIARPELRGLVIPNQLVNQLLVQWDCFAPANDSCVFVIPTQEKSRPRKEIPRTSEWQCRLSCWRRKHPTRSKKIPRACQWLILQRIVNEKIYMIISFKTKSDFIEKSSFEIINSYNVIFNELFWNQKLTTRNDVNPCSSLRACSLAKQSPSNKSAWSYTADCFVVPPANDSCVFVIPTQEESHSH